MEILKLLVESLGFRSNFKFIIFDSGCRLTIPLLLSFLLPKIIQNLPILIKALIPLKLSYIDCRFFFKLLLYFLLNFLKLAESKQHYASILSDYKL